jgi:hypothetical protein
MVAHNGATGVWCPTLHMKAFKAWFDMTLAGRVLRVSVPVFMIGFVGRLWRVCADSLLVRTVQRQRRVL